MRPISLPRTLNFSRGSSRKIFVKQQKETIGLLFSDTNTAAQAFCMKERSPTHSRLITMSPSNHYHPPLAHTRTHGFPAQKLALFRPFATSSCGTNHSALFRSHDLFMWSSDIFLANDWFIFSQCQLKARNYIFRTTD